MIRVFFLIISFLYLNGDNLLSKKYNNIFKARKQQVDSSKDKSIYSVIRPIKVYIRNSSNTQDELTSDIASYGLSFNQDIFKSGNIWRGIDIAKINHKSAYLDIETNKRNLIYNVYSLVLELRKINLDILKQEKLLENSKITKNLKQEKYLKGIIDISELDNALISANNVENRINDLKLNKENILSKFHNLSDKDYKSIKIPHLALPLLEDFIKNNNIHNAKNKISILNKNISVTKAKYLPKISLNVQYGNIDNGKKESSSHSISLEASTNVDIFSTFIDIEQSKINALLQKLQYNQSKKEEENFYNKSIRQIKIYDKKIKLSKQSSNKYNTLVKKIQDLHKNGIRTKEDVIVILNTKKTKDIESDIFKLKKQISIIEIYKHFYL